MAELVTATPLPPPPPAEAPKLTPPGHTQPPSDASRLGELREIRQRIQDQSHRLRELQSERDKLLRERQRVEAMSLGDETRLEARERELVEREAKLEKEWEEIESRRMVLETEFQDIPFTSSRRSPSRRVSFAEGSRNSYASHLDSSFESGGIYASHRSTSPSDTRVHPHATNRHPSPGPPRPLRTPSGPVEYNVRGPPSPAFELPPYRVPPSPTSSSALGFQRSPSRSLSYSPSKAPLPLPAHYSGAAPLRQGDSPPLRSPMQGYGAPRRNSTTVVASRTTVSGSPPRMPFPGSPIDPRLSPRFAQGGMTEVTERVSIVRSTTPESNAYRTSPGRMHPGPVYLSQTNRHFEQAQRNLQELAAYLGRQLQFDHNHTAIIPVQEDITLYCSYDSTTNRLYLYATLVTRLPADKATRLRLFETLLDGALLGRETAGGGVGISLQNNFSLLSSSLDMEFARPSALRELLPAFVDSLRKWRHKVQEVLSTSSPAPTRNSPVQRSPSPIQNAPPAPDHEQAQYAGIGLELTDGVRVDGHFQRYTDGVVVVASKGPAAQAGIVPNDIILMIDGSRITSLAEFQAVARRLVPGNTANIVVQRDGVQFSTDVLLAAISKPPGKKYKNVVKFYSEGVDHV
eukprot:TRINITY_DN1541_c0_g1_i1.p1 TRINITY_DN1541_c0_g1~~TRINITY_DN1541_c0_g1_i1.p1  ORF type:complete len:631 (-),score=47.08 TRINITY_DN1541_c0_g1_i1:73-1965(-)